MESYDVAIIGSGPAGQKAAIQAAKANRRVVLIERDAAVGGACVHHGTIPSKTLRESALNLASMQRLICGASFELGADFAVSNLMGRLGEVLDQHERFWTDQLERNGIDLRIGTATFRDPRTMELRTAGSTSHIQFGAAIIATGSRPRRPAFAEIDHRIIVDSDSILALDTLPRSLIVLGAGVIAAEYATIFACLGVEVTMVDNRSRPIPFVDPELTERFVVAFESAGGRYIPSQTITAVRPDGDRAVVEVACEGEEPRELEAASALVALGRIANSDQLNLEAVGVERCKRGNIEVDENGWTGVGRIYAVGDVIGPPSLAATSMDQGRRAARSIVGLDTVGPADVIPVGIYTIPAISCVGLSIDEARRQFGDCVVGRARYAEVARGCIVGDADGLLKLVAEPGELRVVGVHIIGTGATELVHVGQVALVAGWTIDDFINNVFNFPTFAEAYRIAALDAAKEARRVANLDDGIIRMKRRSAMFVGG